MRHAVSTLAAFGLFMLAACGDNPTQVVPGRAARAGAAHKPVADNYISTTADGISYTVSYPHYMAAGYTGEMALQINSGGTPPWNFNWYGTNCSGNSPIGFSETDWYTSVFSPTPQACNQDFYVDVSATDQAGHTVTWSHTWYRGSTFTATYDWRGGCFPYGPDYCPPPAQ